MGEDLETGLTDVPSAPEAAPEKKIISDFQSVMFELLSQAAGNPAGLEARLVGFSQTFLEQYGERLTEKQRSELYEKRAALLSRMAGLS